MAGNNTSSESTNEKTSWPDWTEIWKDFYFKTEKNMSEIWKDFVGTEAFIKLLNQTIENYLNYTQLAQQNQESFSAASGLAAKKDIARLAEITIAVEEKVDQLEAALASKTTSIEEELKNLLNMAAAMQKSLNEYNQRLSALESSVAALTQTADKKAKQPKSGSSKSKKAVAEKIE